MSEKMTWMEDADGTLRSSCGDYQIISGIKSLMEPDSGMLFYKVGRPETRPHLAYAVVPAGRPGVILFSSRGGSKQLERIPRSRLEGALRKFGLG